MSFSSLELASYGSQPIQLFVFTRGSTVYRYNGGDSALTISGNTYAAHPLDCGEVRFTGEAQTDELTIAAPANLPVVEDFTAVPPQQRVSVQVLRYHVGATPAVRWSGFVDRVNRTSRAKVNVICKSLLGGMKQNGARLIWQRQCPHVIYGPGCGVNKSEFAVSAVVSAINGSAIVAAGMAAAGEGRLTGGFIEWTTPQGFPAWRAVSSHGTDWASILGGTRGIEVGTGITAYPGCARTPEGCALFNNQANYGGFRHLPGKSPYDGNPVF